MKDKKRIDVLLVEKGMAESRQKAQALIMSGNIFVDNERIEKSGTKVLEDSSIELKGKGLKYVSRGGLKLEKAVDTFSISFKNKKCIDVGASTGGFTDCMLQNGAIKVYSVDVGYGQIAWELRKDDRVVVMDRTNFRYVKPEDINDEIDFISIDVSFISLKIVLPVAKEILKENGEIVCLIKPQFEAGRDRVGKKGVVRNPEVHKEVVEEIISFCQINGLKISGFTFSPVKGPQGNIEYLLYLYKTKEVCNFDNTIIQKIIKESHLQT